MATPPTPYKKYTKTIRARYTTACHITASRNQSSRPAPPLQGYASEHSTTDEGTHLHSQTTSPRRTKEQWSAPPLKMMHTHTRHYVNHIFKGTDPWRRRRPRTKNILKRTACHLTASRNQSSRPTPPLQGNASEHSTTDEGIPPHSPMTSPRRTKEQ